ncbi:hypothetical protein BDR26DRAFT_2920 [Obelidium mucronatum]|nr:hypothetical protein BDR26DRAFT_2920 [Obelidium mucronatum]
MNQHHQDKQHHHHRPPLTVLFGSETGTAEECAQMLGREAERRQFPSVAVLPLDEFEFAESAFGEAPLLVFVVATAGDGAQPRNAQRFWRRLMRKRAPRLANSGARVAVLGLGDSAFAKFNWAAKKLHKRLLQLGAEAIVPLGLADDQHLLGVDGVLDPWSEELWKALDNKFPLPSTTVLVSKTVLPSPSFVVEFVDSVNAVDSIEPSCSSNVATCIQNTRITHADHFQDVRHVVFNVNGAENLSYDPADVMTINPRNLDADVQEVLDFLEWNDIADKPIKLIPNRPNVSLPSTIKNSSTTTLTLRKAFTHHLDIFGRPKRYFFHLLSFFTPDLMHAEKLLEFASAQGQDELYAYCHKLRRTYFEVLSDFHSCKRMIPVNYLFDLIPFMRPKMYSISGVDIRSSSTVATTTVAAISGTPSPPSSATTIEITVGIVKYKTRMVKMREGICSKMISLLKCGDTVNFKIDKGTMKLPIDPSVPTIFIGAGTGIAPMRSLLLERVHQGATEFEALELNGKLKLFNAFSRDDPNKVVYIQHRMVENGQLIWDYLQRGGVIYVSGNAQRIPRSVNGALVDILKAKAGMSEEEAVAYLAYYGKDTAVSV